MAVKLNRCVELKIDQRNYPIYEEEKNGWDKAEHGFSATKRTVRWLSDELEDQKGEPDREM